MGERLRRYADSASPVLASAVNRYIEEHPQLKAAADRGTWPKCSCRERCGDFPADQEPQTSSRTVCRRLPEWGR